MKMPDLTSLSGDPAAARALADLAAQRWRKARDAAKELCKKDRPRYVPLLIAANAGLAQDLLERGLTQDAIPVIAYLKTIAPPEFVTALEAKQNENRAVEVIQKSQPGQAAAAGWDLLSAAVATLEQGGTVSAAALLTADQFVSGIVPPPPAVDGVEDSLANELSLVQRAMDATGDGRWEEAQETLRGLPRRSVFQHWRLFLRGVRCVHQGETTTAQQCFDALPAGSATARAAAPWRDLCGLPATADKAPGSATAALFTALCGAPAEWAAPLAAADAHWRGLRPRAAFEALRQGLRDHFPDDRPGLPGLLTDLLLNGKLHTSGITRPEIQDYFDCLYDLVMNKQCRSEREQKIIRRMLCLNDGFHMEPGALELHFSDIIRIDRKLHGADPLRESAAWSLAAEQIMGGMASDELEVRDCTPRERGIIRTMHLQAAALDPAHPAPALALLRYYEEAGETAAAKKETAALSKKFPDNKDLLLRSADAAVSRKAFAGALTSLRRARAIDPLDADVRRRLASALFASAVETAKKKPVPASLWDEVEPLLTDGPARPQSLERDADFTSFRWVMQAGRALLENDSAAPAAAPSPLAGYFVRLLFAARWRRLADLDRMEAHIIAAAPFATWLDCEWTIRAAAWNESVKRSSAVGFHIVRSCLEAVSGPLLQSGPIAADPGGALDCALALNACTAGDHGNNFYSLASTLIRNMASAFDSPANHPGADYRIRLAAILHPHRPAPPGYSCYCPLLEEVEATARAAGDERSAGAAHRLIGQCGGSSPGFDFQKLFDLLPPGGIDGDESTGPGSFSTGKSKGRKGGFRQPDIFHDLFF